MSGNIDLDGNKIINMGPGTDPLDAVNKQQMDNADTNLQNQITTNTNEKINRDGTQAMTGALNMNN